MSSLTLPPFSPPPPPCDCRAQERWGACTLDAFASEPTALVDRFWTAQKCDSACGTDALKQAWTREERLWAHPPPGLLPDLARLLKQDDRHSEVIVCVPFWPSTQWFRDIAGLADDKLKHRAGKLQKLPGVDDAPGRLTSWPIMIFHVPSPFGKHAMLTDKRRGSSAAALPELPTLSQPAAEAEADVSDPEAASPSGEATGGEAAPAEDSEAAVPPLELS